MSLKDLQDHLKKGKKEIRQKAEKAMKAAALSGALAAAAVNPALAGENHRQDDKDRQAKTERVEKINLFGVAELEQVKEGDGIRNRVDGKTIRAEDLDRRRISKDWQQEQKKLFENAETDRVDTLSIAKLNDGAAAYYDADNKNITTRYIDMSGVNADMLADLYVKQNENAEKDAALKYFQGVVNQISEINDPQSLVARSTRVHEEQHRTNDKLGIYAPGLSPEQYAVINQYDECSANIAELNCYLGDYKKALAGGMSKEEALKIFDRDGEKRFAFFQSALARGLDPDSKEAKKLMVGGTMKMWQKDFRPMYNEQTEYSGKAAVGRSDAATTILGNEQELQKRIGKIFDNIGNNDYCKQNGIEVPGRLSGYLPAERMELSPNVKENIAETVEARTGLDAKDRELLQERIAGKNDKRQIRNLLKVLSGRKTPEQVSARKSAYTGREQSQDNNGAWQKAMLDKASKTR